MGRKCNVLDCPSDSKRIEDNGVTFHKMPVHPDLRPKWIELCRIPEERQIHKVIYVCSRHFRRTDFCNFKGTKYMLKQGALPSVFPWTKSLLPTQAPKIAVENEEQCENLEIKTEPVDEDKQLNPDIREEKPVTEEPSEQIEPKVEKTTEEVEVERETSATKNIVSKIKNEPDTLDSSTAKYIKEPTLVAKKECVLTIKKEIPSEIQNSIALAINTEIKSEQINFLPGTLIEANDFNEKWNPATILEVDYDENEVFVEFDKHLNKANEWIPMDSSRLRPYQPSSSNSILSFVLGEKVMALWSKSHFPATIRKILDPETYEVLFDDGFVKILKYHKISKIENSSSVGKHASPLFEPVKGSKEERRERKRKFNASELFGKISNKKYKAEDYIKTEPDDDIQSQEEFQNNEGEEWTCKWLNGEPVGEESVIDGVDGPRRSIIVADHRLPPGWEKHLVQRQHGAQIGKWDSVIVNPQGKRFSSRTQVKTWLEDKKLDHNIDQFDFCLHLNRARKLGLYEITDPEAIAASKAKLIRDSIKFHKKVPTPKSGSLVNLPISPETPEPEIEEDTSHYLKIIHEDGSYKCPIEGCGKIFRKENLAQMHVKHYHPESAKLLGSTPNVADLAYARTVGEHIDDIVPKARLVGSPLEKDKPIKIECTPKLKTPVKILQPKILAKPEEIGTKTFERPGLSSPPHTAQKPVTKDSEIIRLLNSEPKTKTLDSIFDSVTSKSNENKEEESLSVEAADKYSEIKLKDLLHKAEPIPYKKDEHRSTGIKTLLPVHRQNVDEIKPEFEELETGFKSHAAAERLKMRKRQSSDNSEAKRRKSIKYDTDDMSDLFEGDSQSQDAFGDRKPATELQTIAPISDSPQVIIEGGEVIRLVHMRSEEIINCTCGITEEDGLMIQCELCLCWQHAHCNNIQRENEVPEKYVCYICKNPQKMRASKKYIHDQEWLKQGVLPSGSYHTKDEITLKERFEKLRKSHELSGCVVELNEYIHNLRVKLKTASNKDHPKLYLWSKPWEKLIPNENLNVLLNSKADIKQDMKEENLNSSFSGSDHSYIKTSAFGDLALKSMLEPPIEDEIISKEKSVIDDSKIKSETELISILENGEPSPIRDELKDESAEFPKIDLNSMIANNIDDKTEVKEDIISEDNKENPLSAISSGILSAGSLELALSQTDLVSQFAQLNEVEVANEVSVVHIPQPEAVINPIDCKMNLLEHVAHFQSLVTERLNCIEAEISELEDQDSNLGPDDDEDAVPKMKQTLQMLLNDLTTMRQIASLSN